MGAPNLSTSYLGLDLSGPVIASSSPLTRQVETMVELAEAGVSAVVLPSLFEEDVLADADAGTQLHVARVREAKAELKIPVIASLNATRPGSWQRYAEELAAAGADAIELNLYSVTADPTTLSADLEMAHLAAIEAVKIVLDIPLAVKLSPYYSAISAFAGRAVDAGADGLVLFNRFYAPDIDIDALQLFTNVDLSVAADQRLALRWLGILRAQLPEVSLACTGGVQSGEEVIKALLVGADVSYTASAVLQQGVGAVIDMLATTSSWLEEHGFASIAEAKGQLSAVGEKNLSFYERANYLEVLKSEW